MLIGGSVLSAFLLAGCATDQEPPPEDEVIETPGDNDVDNGVNNGTDDINTENDADPALDNNEQGEDMIEDDRDVNDKDNQDE